MSANDKNKVNKQSIQNVEVKSTVTTGTAVATISTSNFNALNEVNTKNTVIYIPPAGDVKQVLQKQANTNNEVEYCILASETLTSVSGTNHTNQDSVSSHVVFNKNIRILPSAEAVVAKEFHGNLKGTASIATYAEYDKSEINKTAKTTINDKYATKNDAVKTAQTIVTSDDEYPILAGNRPASTATTNATLTTVFNKDIKLNPKTKTITAEKFDGTAIYAVYDDSEQSSTSKKKISNKYAKKSGDTFTGIMEYEEAITIDDSSAFNMIPNVDYVKNKFNEAKNSHYNTKLVIGKSNTATKDANVTSNGDVHINLLDDNTIRSSVIIKGAGSASVTANTVPSGDTTIIVTSTDTNDNDKVEQVLTNVNKDYPMLLAYSDTTKEIGSKNVYFTSDIHANPSTGIITAKSFYGSLTGTANRAIYDNLGRQIDTTYALINNGHLESAIINNITLTGAAIAPSLATSVKNTRIANADFVHRVAESANTHYNTALIVGNSNSATTNVAAKNNEQVYVNLFDDNILRNSINIIGRGNTSVTSTVNDGKTQIIVYSKDDNNKVEVLQSDANEIYPLLASSKTIPAGADNISAAEALFNKDIYINPSISAIYAKNFIGNVIGDVIGTADGAIYDSEENKKDVKLSIIDKYSQKINSGKSLSITHIKASAKNSNDIFTINLHNDTSSNDIISSINATIDNSNIIQNNKDTDNANMYPLLASDSTLNTSINGAIYDRSVYTNNIYMVPGKGEIYAHDFHGSLTGTASITTNNINNEPIEGTYARLDGSEFTNSITRTIKVTDSSEDKELTTVKYVKDKFTDGITNYHYKTMLTIGNKTDTINTAAENGNTYLHLNEYNVNNENKNSQKIKIVGKGATSVTSDEDGRITIYSVDTNDNDKVTQNLSNEDTNYPILLGYVKNAKDSISANTVWFSSSVKVNPSAGIITAPQFKGNVTGNVDGEASVGTYARYDDDEIDNAVKQKISRKYAERVKTVNNLTIDNDDSNPDKNKITINLRNNNDSIISSKSFTITHSKIEQKESTTSKYFPILASNINTDSIEADNNTASIFTKSININPSTGTIYAKKFNGILEGVAQYAQYDDGETSAVKTKIADKYPLKINGTLQGSSIDNATLDNSYAKDLDDINVNTTHITNAKFVQSVVAADKNHWHTDLIIGSSDKDCVHTGTNENNKVYLNLIDRNPANKDDSIRSAINIIGTGHTSVTSEVNDGKTKIIIHSQDDNSLLTQNRSNSEDIYPLLASSKTIPAGEDNIGDETSIFSKHIKMQPVNGIIYANEFIGHLTGDVTGEASIATYARYDDDELSKGDTALTIVNKYSQKINSGKRLSMTHTKASTENNAIDTVIINLHNDTDIDSIISSVNTTIDNSKFIQLKDNTDNKYPLLASDKLDTDANKRYTSSIFNPKVYIQPSLGLIHATVFEGNVEGTVARSIGDSIGRQIDTTYATKNDDTIKGHLINNSTLTSSYAENVIDVTTSDSLVANTKFVQDVVADDSHHWHTDLIIGSSDKDCVHTGTNENNKVYLNLIDRNPLNTKDSIRSAINIIGTGHTSVTSEVNDGETTIIIYSQDDNNLMTQNRSDVNNEYPLLASSKTIPTGEDNIGDETSIFSKHIKMNPSTGIIYAKDFTGHFTGNLTGIASVATYAIYDENEKGSTAKTIVNKYSQKINSGKRLSMIHTKASTENNAVDKVIINLHNDTDTDSIISSVNTTIDNSKFIQLKDNTDNKYPLLASDKLNTDADKRYTSAIFNSEIYIQPSAGIIHAKKIEGNIDGIADYAIYDSSEKTSSEPLSINDKFAFKEDDTVKGHLINNSTLTGSYAENVIDVTTSDSLVANTKFVQDVVADDAHHYHSKLITGNKTDSINTITDNTNTYLVLVEEDSLSAIQFEGSGVTTVTSDASGKIIIASTDTNDKVAQNVITENKEYPILIASKANAVDNIETSEINFDSKVRINPSLGAVTANTFIGTLEGYVSGEASVGTYARYDDSDFGDTKQKISDKYATNKLAVHSLSANINENHEDGITEITITSNNKYNESVDSINFIIDNAKMIQVEDNTSNEFPILASDITKESIQSNNHTSAIFNKSIRINPSIGVIYANKFSGSFDGISEYASYDDSEKGKDKQIKIADKYPLKINGTLQGSSIDNATLDNSYAEDIDDVTTSNSHIANTKFVQDVVNDDVHHWHTDLIIGSSDKDCVHTGTNENNKVYLNLIDRNPANKDDSIRSAINIIGTGHTSVTSEVNDGETTIIIHSQDDNSLLTQNRSNSEDIYPLLASSKTIPAGEDNIGDETSIFSKHIKMQPANGIIYANEFIGHLTGDVTGEASIATYARYDDDELTKGDLKQKISFKYAERVKTVNNLTINHIEASAENSKDIITVNLYNNDSSIISSDSFTINNTNFIQQADNTDNKYPLLASNKLTTDANTRYTSAIFNSEIYINPSAGIIHAKKIEGDIDGISEYAIYDSSEKTSSEPLSINDKFAFKEDDTVKGHLINNSTLTSNYAENVIDVTTSDSLVANTKFVQDVVADDSHHWHTDLIIGNDDKDCVNAAAESNGQVYLNLIDRNPLNTKDSIRSAINIIGTGHTSVTSTVNDGKTQIAIYSTDTNDKVAQNVITENKEYPILIATNANAVDNIEAAEINFDSKVRINPSLGAVTANTFIGNLKGTIEGEASVATYARYDDSDFGDTKQKISDKYATNKLAVHSLSANVNENHEDGITEITITSNNKYNESVDSINFVIDNAKIIQVEDNTSNEFPILASDIIKESIQSNNHTSAIFNKSIRINPSIGVIYANKFSGNFDGISEYSSYDDSEKGKDKQIKIADKYALKINGTLQGSSIDNATLDNSYAEDIDDVTTSNSHIANTKFVQDVVNDDAHHWHTNLIVGNDDKDTSNASTDENGKVYLNLIDNNLITHKESIRSAINIVGDGHTSVTATIKDGQAQIIIYSQDDNNLMTQNRSDAADIYPILASSKTIPAGEDNIGDETSIFSKHIKMQPAEGIIYANTFIGNLEGTIKGEASVATYARYDDDELTKGDLKQKISFKYAERVKTVNNLTIVHDNTSTVSQDKLTINLHNNDSSIISSDSFIIDSSKIIQKADNTDNKYPLLASDKLTTDTDQRYTSAIFNSEIYINPSAGIIHAKKIEGDIEGISEYAIYDSSEKTSSEPLSINDKFAFKENDTVKGHLINNSTLTGSYAENVIDITTNNLLIANTKFVQDVVAADKNHWHTDLIIGNDDKDCINAAAESNGQVYLNLIDRNPSNMIDSIRSAINIIGDGHTSVTSTVNDGKTQIVIYSTDTNDKVAQNVITDNDEYPILIASTAKAVDNIETSEINFDSKVRINPSLGTIYANTFVGNLEGTIKGEASIATYARYDDSDDGDTKQKISDKYATNKLAVHSLSANVNENHEDGITEITITSNNKYNESVDSINFVIDNAKIIQVEDNTSNEFPILASDIIKESIQSSNHTSAIFNKSIRINPSTGIIYANKFSGSFDGISEYSSYDDNEKGKDKPIKIADKYALKVNGTLTGSSIDNATLDNSYAKDLDDINVNTTHIANAKFVQSVVAADKNHWHSKLITGDKIDTVNTITDNSNTHIVLVEENSIRAAIQLEGSGVTTITSDANGKIIIASTDTNDRVKQKQADDDEIYPLLASSKTIPAGEDDIGDEFVIFNKDIKMNPSTGVIYANTFIGNLQGTIEGEASIATYARYDDSDDSDTKQKISDKYATNKLAVHSLSANVNENHSIGTTEITIASNNKYNELVDSINFVIDNAKIIQVEDNTSNEFPILASDIIKESIQSNNHTSAIFNKSIRINPSTGVIYANKFSGSFDGTSEYAIYDDIEKTADKPVKIADKYALKINGTLTGSSIDNATLDNSYAEDIDDPTTNDSRIANTKFVHSVVNGDGNHWHSRLITGDKTDTNNTITDNNNTHIVLIEEESIRTAIQFEGAGVTTVTSDASGKIIIASNDNNDKVAQNVITENKEYPILIASTADAIDNIEAAEINFDSKVRINPSLGAVTANTFIGNLKGTIEGEASVATYARYDDSDDSDTKQKISDKYATNKLAVHSLSANVNENHSIGATEITITSSNKYGESVDSINYTIDNAKIIQKEDNTSNEFPILASDITKESIQSSNHASSIFTKSIRINPSTGVIYANKFSGSFDGTSEYATYDNEEKIKDRPIKISDKYALKTNGTLIESIIENATLTGIPYATTISDPNTSTDQIATTKFVHSVVDGDGNHWHSQLITGDKTDTINTITDNNNTHIVLAEENSIRAAIQFEGVNNVSISSDTSGKIIISSTDTNDKVKQNVINNNDEYPVLLVTNANAVDNIDAAEINFSSKVHINPSLGAITAETFKGYLDGEASLATNATTANTATYAIYDINGDKIDETYIKEADVITNIDTNTTEHILTFNKDGSVITKSIADNTVQQQYSDTETNEYPLLASSSIASALTANTTTTVRFNKDITINPSKKAITAASFIGSLSGTATNAVNDEDGNNIKDTYINKDQGIVDISVSGTTITFTRGNSETYSASTIDENIDIAVQQDKSIANTTFPLLATPVENQTADTYTGKAIYAEGIKINPYTSEIIANKFTGILNGAATKAEKDGNDNNIVNTYMPKVYTNTVTLSPSGWNIEGDYYVTQFVDSKITDKHLINIIIDKDSQAIATLANMLPINENYGTYIKLYAKNQPTDNITISYYALTLA